MADAAGFFTHRGAGPGPEQIARRIGDALIMAGEVEREDVEATLRARAPIDGRLDDILFARTPKPAAFAPRKAKAIREDPRVVVAGPWLDAAPDPGVLEELALKFGPALARRAATRRPEAMSFRIGPAVWQRVAVGAVIGGFASVFALAPSLGFSALAWAGCAVIAVNAILWLVAIAAAFGGDTRDDPEDSGALTTYPTVSVLVPLYREPETAPMLIAALKALRYPAAKLEIKLILEADDDETGVALAALSLPSHFEVLIAPPGAPQTKPRALNYALDFTTGDYIGIYDAEDRPASEQIRSIVSIFQRSGSEVACVQARLGYYNVKENWLTRCFELEYAAWFDTLLPGLRRAGLPLPLGGTSLFVRREALEAVGAWDSHNVTEDADLGMALARAGYQTALTASMTEEEASSRVGAWVKQRSRWLKGYLATWLTHMRAPVALWRDLGTKGFIGFNAILLSAVFGYLLFAPLWMLALISIWTPALSVAGSAGGPLFAAAAIAGPALAAAAAFGLKERRRLAYIGWVLSAPLYWLLGAAAAWLAVWELFSAPTKWRKTQHGVGDIAAMVQKAGAADN